MASRRRVALGLAAGLVFLGGAPPATLAQGSGPGGMMFRGSGGWGPGAAYGRMYDPRAVETVQGEILSIDRVTPMSGMSAGIHVTLKAGPETLSVHLGPGWFVENQDVKLAPRDAVEIKGSRVTIGGRTVLIAAEVRKGDDTLVLRDAGGRPAWSAVHRR